MAKMNAGQDNFLVACVSKGLCLMQYLRQWQTPAGATGIRDYTVCAKTLATILYPEVCPAACAESFDWKTTYILCLSDCTRQQRIIYLPLASDDGDKFVFMIVADQGIFSSL